MAESEALFLSRDQDNPDLALRGRLERDKLVNKRPVRLQLPDGSSQLKGPRLGRGEHLFVFDDSSAYYVRVSN